MPMCIVYNTHMSPKSVNRAWDDTLDPILGKPMSPETPMLERGIQEPEEPFNPNSFLPDPNQGTLGIIPKSPADPETLRPKNNRKSLNLNNKPER